jgi:hypothetical protein
MRGRVIWPFPAASEKFREAWEYLESLIAG